MKRARELQSVRLTLSFTVGGLLVDPPTTSIEAALYDHTGQLLHAYQLEAVDPNLNIAASHQTIASGRDFEKRTLRYGFPSPEGWQDRQLVYHVYPVLNFVTTPDDVRAFIGMSEAELPDQDLDLDEIYFHVADEIGRTELDAALISGTSAERKANEAIKLRAVIEVYPSLMQRLQQMESDGVLQVRKQVVKDLSHVLTAAKTRYAAVLGEITPTPTSTPVPLFTVVQSPDPITGA